MRQKRLLLYSMYTLLYLSGAYAQQTSIGQHSIQAVVDSAKQGTNYEPNIKALTEREIDDAITTAWQFAADTSFSVKWNLALTVDKLFWHSRNSSTQQRAVAIIVRFMQDENSRLSYLADQMVARYPHSVFGEEEKMLLVNLAEKTSKPIREIELFKLCARINATEITPLLQEKAYGSDEFRIRWVALVSLTRLGDKQAETEMIKAAREFPLTEEAINTLFPDIVFSRSHKAISLLIRQIQVNNGTCASLTPSARKGIPCAYMILKVVAPYIKGLNWYGENGMEHLAKEDALKKARTFFKGKGDSWALVDEA